MSLIKRITILAALATSTAGLSACGDLSLFLEKLTICAHGTNEEATQIGCVPANSGEPIPPFVEPSTAAAVRPGKALRARFTAKSVTRPDFFKRAGGAGATNIVTRGRFSGSLVGDSGARRRFSSGSWISRGELNYTIRSGKVTGDAYMLLRFRRRGAGSLCLSVGVKAAGTKRGKVESRGSFVALGGTGEGAKIVGSGSFSQVSGRSSGRLRARGRLQTGTRRPLPALCAALAQMR
jgi:hypothetical protein